jgi:cytochrome P450
MTFIVNFVSKVFMTIIILLNGVFNLLGLIFRGLGAVFGSGGTWKTRIAGVLTSPDGQRMVFGFLRAFLPNLVIGKVLVKAYENTGTAIISRNDDVKEVLNRDEDFEVVYGPRMRTITGGENFFLGMQNIPRYTQDTSNMRIAIRRDDIPGIIIPAAAKQADEIVSSSGGKLDLPQALTLQVPAQMVAEYFGTPGPTRQEMIDWTTVMFWYLFIDLQADPKTIARAEEAAKNCRDYLDKAIAERQANPTDADDVLNRCLEMQAAEIPGMDDLGIRNNMIGMLIGAIPTISKSATQIMDQLFDRPDALAVARNAAMSDQDDVLAGCIFEAFRFNPINPVIYRRAARDAVVARGTLRARKIPKGSMVFAANFSAMFDPLKIDAPNSFRTDRPWEDYMLWGYAMHTCSGAYINRAIIPALLKPLLKQNNLRRAAGPAGRIDTSGTPFAVHMHVEFDPA